MYGEKEAALAREWLSREVLGGAAQESFGWAKII
jgi:hypothetical protein